MNPELFTSLAPRLLSDLVARQDATLATLQEWVECESPSQDVARINDFGDRVAAAFVSLGATLHRHKDSRYGDHLEFALPGTARGKERPLLVLGHLDTVYPADTLSRMPFRVEGGRVWGPGVMDIKGGIVATLAALQALQAAQCGPRRPLRLFWVSDEEVGSHGSRPLTEGLAREAHAALVVEPGSGLQGALKTARKGIAEFTLTTRGRAAHAGVDFEQGASAIVELAQQILMLAELTDPLRGITVNPGVISGGTRTNVVAAEAQVRIDVRARHAADLEEVERQIRGLGATDARVGLSVRGCINRPPMERTAAIARLFQHARALGGALGLDLAESATGGGSDGNFTAAVGTPTLDGLGMVGEGAHSPGENFLLDQMAPRAALLAGLFLTL